MWAYFQRSDKTKVDKQLSFIHDNLITSFFIHPLLFSSFDFQRGLKVHSTQNESKIHHIVLRNTRPMIGPMIGSIRNTRSAT